VAPWSLCLPKSLVESAGGTAHVYPTDLRDPPAIMDTTEAILSDCDRIDLVANVAGVWHDDDRAFQGPLLHEIGLAELLDVLDVGIRAPMLLTAGLLPTMVRRRAGHVVNVSGTFSEGARGWLHYFVSKKAMEEFTRGLAQEVRDFQIKVNCISPADVATEPVRRLYPEAAKYALEPEEIAEVALMLISDASRHITGQVIEVRSQVNQS
jgi:NAD(P)-dependent dehydrogenase (short-subunit alcohol dehydrogenase family)